MRLSVASLFDRADDAVNAGQHGLLQRMGEGHGNFVAVNVFDRGVEIVETLLLDFVENSTAHAAITPVLVDDDAAIGFGDGRGDGFNVQWAKGAEVNQLNVDAVVGMEMLNREADD